MSTLSRLLARSSSCLLVTLLLCSCGATINVLTPISPERALARKGALPPLAADPSGREQHKQLKKLDSKALQQWAHLDPDFLVPASREMLRRAEDSRLLPRSQRSGAALISAHWAWQSLQNSPVSPGNWLSDPRSQPAARLYQNALPRALAPHLEALAQGQNIIAFKTPLGTRSLRVRQPQGLPAPYFDEILLADTVKVNGLRSRSRSPGMGAPLLGLREQTKARAEEFKFFAPKRPIAIPLGSLIRFDKAGTPTLDLVNLEQQDNLRVSGKSIPLAGDYTLPVAFVLKDANDLGLGISMLRHADTSKKLNGVYLIEPYDPNRIPVLLTHGLSSSPLFWRDILNEAMASPEIRKNYQFLLSFYSSGLPIVQSASIIREDLRRIRRDGDPGGRARASRDLVLVGHSMGGVITRTLVTDMNDTLWRQLSDQDFDTLDLPPEDREILKKWIFWEPESDVTETIFLSTPHRGASMADAGIAHLGSRLVALPRRLIDLQVRLISSVYGALGGDPRVREKYTGIASLSPKSPLYAAFQEAPMQDGTKLHSIIGDRGRGDSPDSSDGVVGYWSSHLDESESEIIVPTGHGVQTAPETAREVERILIENLE